MTCTPVESAGLAADDSRKRLLCTVSQAAAVYLPTDTDSAEDSAWSEVLDRLARMIPTSDSFARRRRVAALGTAMFALLAELERTAGSPSNCAGSLDEVIEMLAAMLTAPVPAVAAAR